LGSDINTGRFDNYDRVMDTYRTIILQGVRKDVAEKIEVLTHRIFCCNYGVREMKKKTQCYYLTPNLLQPVGGYGWQARRGKS